MVSASRPQGPGEDGPLGGTVGPELVDGLPGRQLIWLWGLEPDCLDNSPVYSFLALCPCLPPEKGMVTPGPG